MKNIVSIFYCLGLLLCCTGNAISYPSVPSYQEMIDAADYIVSVKVKGINAKNRHLKRYTRNPSGETTASEIKQHQLMVVEYQLQVLGVYKGTLKDQTIGLWGPPNCEKCKPLSIDYRLEKEQQYILFLKQDINENTTDSGQTPFWAVGYHLGVFALDHANPQQFENYFFKPQANSTVATDRQSTIDLPISISVLKEMINKK